MKNKNILFLFLIVFSFMYFQIIHNDKSGNKKYLSGKLKKVLHSKKDIIRKKHYLEKSFKALVVKNISVEKASVVSQESKWEKDSNRLSNIYSIVSKKWSNKVKQLFIQEFYLTEKDFKEYLSIRNQYEEEKLDSYGKFFNNQNLNNKNNIIERDYDAITRRIDQRVRNKYLEKIKRKIGNENYPRFIDVLNQFNAKQKERAKDESPQVILDL